MAQVEGARMKGPFQVEVRAGQDDQAKTGLHLWMELQLVNLAVQVLMAVQLWMEVDLRMVPASLEVFV